MEDQQELLCLITIPRDEQPEIVGRLSRALPELAWHDSDSAWDKIAVWGERPGASVRVYRYESPGPFELRIRLPNGERIDAVLDRVLAALDATIIRRVRG